MKFFVLGCNGMAGHIISLYLKEQGHEVLGFDRALSLYVDSIAGDARDKEFLRKVIIDDHFDSIINCIGILNQFAEQHKALASFLNSYFPHFLAEATEGTDTQVIHMSTDCVFSGRKGYYIEDDLKDNETFYGRSKALGELEDDKNITMRNSIVGPDINPNGSGLLNWFMRQDGVINGFTNKMWTGLTTLELAKAMEAAAKIKAHGLYHTVPDHAISKYELVSLFNHYLRNDTVKINPVEGARSDMSLNRTKFNFSYIIPDYDIMVAEMAEWIKNHNEIYPHYFNK